MYGTKKRLLKSMSTKNIDSRYSSSPLTHSQGGTPKVVYDEVKLTPLSRSDFDMNVINKWVEIRASNSPKRRSFHTSFLFQNFLYIFGGKDISEGKLNDLWKVNLKEQKPQWEKITPTNEQQLPYLAHHTGTLVEGSYYIIGGQNEFTRQTNDVWIYNIEQNSIEKIEQKENQTVFPKIEMHSCSYNQEKKELIIFGGYAKGELLNSMYTFNIEAKEFAITEYANKDNVPMPRTNHSSLLINNSLFIFGGSAKDGLLLNDLWKFDLSSLSWEKIGPNEDDEKKDDNIYKEWPSPRSGHSICNIGSTIYLFGGKIGNVNEANDFWKCDYNNKKFTIIHDTLLEQYTKNEILLLTKKEDSNSGRKKNFKLLTKKEMEERKNPFSKNYSGRKGSLPKYSLTKSQSTVNLKNKYEKEIFANAGFHSMKHSSIFTLDDKGVFQAINDLNAILPFKIGKQSGDSLNGHVPLPRDGQTMNIFDNQIIIFGGDRNKYPFNDLFMFIL